MLKFIIEGEHELKGEVSIGGAKNAALKFLAAAVLSKKIMHLKNVPDIEDIRRMIELIVDLGGKIQRINKNEYTIDTSSVNKTILNSEISGKFRASVILSGPLLARFGEVKIPLPGGCRIGQRPINLFIESFKALGCKVTKNEKYYFVTGCKLKGAKIVLPQASVTVTETIMMTAVLIPGVTIIKNAAMEPEIAFLADYLNQQGAKIKGQGTHTITIDGVKEINASSAVIMPDRIEAGTLVIAGVLNSSSLLVKNIIPEHIDVVLTILQQVGANFKIGKNYIQVLKAKNLQAVNVTTQQYPGFPTDLQAPYAVLMTQATGLSLIHETIFDGRLFYADILSSMNAKIIMCDPHRVVINGPTKLYGREIISPDARAGMALVLAGLVARGKTTIDNIYQIERGYEDIANRLNKLGAVIKRQE